MACKKAHCILKMVTELNFASNEVDGFLKRIHFNHFKNKAMMNEIQIKDANKTPVELSGLGSDGHGAEKYLSSV